MYFHGWGNGQFENKGGDTNPTRDLNFSQIAQQIAASARPLIGILPQLTSDPKHSGGGMPDHNGSNIDAPLLIREVFEKLHTDQLLAKDQQPGRLIFAGHSAGGRTAMDEARDPSNQTTAGLFLFDGHIVDAKAVSAKPITTLLEKKLTEEQKILAKLPADKQKEWLSTNGFVFQMSGEGGTYGTPALEVQRYLSQYFSNTQKTAGVHPTAIPLWKANYSAQKVFARHHETVISSGQQPEKGNISYIPGTGNLEKSISALHPPKS